MDIGLRDADLHMAQLMPLPLTVSCFSKIQIGFTFLVPADLGIPKKGPLNGCVCVCSYTHQQIQKTALLGRICCCVCPQPPPAIIRHKLLYSKKTPAQAKSHTTKL